MGDLYAAFATGPVTINVVGAGITIWDPNSGTYAASASLTVPGQYLYRFLAQTQQWVLACS